MSSRGEFHEDYSREEKIKASSDRNFGLVFAGFFALLAGLAWWKENPHWIWWGGGVALMLIIVLARPSLLKPLNRAWTLLGLTLFKFISPITLGFVYYVVMTPIGLMLRLLKKDILRLKYEPAAHTYWIQRDPPGPPSETMKNQF